MNDTAITVKNLSKRYVIGKHSSGTLRDTLGRLLKPKNEKESFWALKDISFEIKQGDVIGIIGSNGAGKSTLLKILSKITYPSTGRIEINGRVASLLEVGTGFHHELTGRENIFMNGALLGMKRSEIKHNFDEIVDFSGVEKFIDTPVKHYSSGMYVRLAFAVAAHLEPEILLVDEVLAVGDIEFQKKCLGKMGEVAKNGRTVLFVSHNMSAIKQLCGKSMLLENGELKQLGDTDTIISNYVTQLQSKYNTPACYRPEIVKHENVISFKYIKVLNKDLQITNYFTNKDSICIQFEFNINSSRTPFTIFVTIENSEQIRIFSAEKKIDSPVMRLYIEEGFLTSGTYSLHTFINWPRTMKLEEAREICSFSVEDIDSTMSVHGSYNHGLVFGNYHWE